MTALAPVVVVGWDGRPLDPGSRHALETADLVVGGARHLAAVAAQGILVRGERIVLGAVGSPLTRSLETLVAYRAAGRSCVVVASGDPGFFGVVRALREAGADVRVRPGASSVAQAFGRIGLAWEDAVVVSAHGRPAGPALAAARVAAKVAVLTSPQLPAGDVVTELRRLGREVWVAERLGEDDERVRAGADCRPPYTEPNVVLAVDRGAAQVRWHSGVLAPPAWALPEDDFDHRDSMVTKREVRALALASLAPALGRTVWDVGAGSGSVGVECARFGADVIAVERDAGQCERVRANAGRHGARLEVVEGAAPAALAGLRDPDAVFVGGGGTEVVEAVGARPGARTVVVALAAVERVGPALESLQRNHFDVMGVQLAASRLAPLPDGAHRLAATNPVTLVTGVRS